MDSMKKIGAGCSLLFALFLGTAATPAEAAFDELQAMEVTRLSGGLKSTEEETGVIDSTESYKYIINENGTAEITDYLKEEENVEIPSMLDGHPVTVIQNRAFEYCRELKNIFIPQNIKEIDGNIVQGSHNLTRIEVDVRNAAYTSVDGILYNTDITELLAVPEGKDLADFQFPDSVVCIGEEAFYGNESLSFTELIIPDPVTAIGDGAFMYCGSLRKAVIGKNVKTIPNRVFSGCFHLSEVVISNGIQMIGSQAFEYCRELEKIFIPDSILKIGSRAFVGCLELEKIFIPQNVEEIDGNIVEDAEKLTKIEVDARNAFYTSKNGILYNKDMTELLIVPGGKDVAGFQFPDSVVCIGEDAFSGNQSASFTGLIIPDKITAIGSGAFVHCHNLRKVVIGKNIKKIPSSAFFESGLSEIEIGNGVQIIGSYAFWDCPLHKIIIPDNVTEIGEKAFYNCSLLKDITIPKSVTKMEYCGIGYDEGDGSISSITITGYRDTAAYQYAKKHSIAFRDIETGKDMRFDLVSVPIPNEKITVLKARKKKIELEYYPEEDVTYQIAIRKAGASSWKKYNKTKTWASIRGLKPGKRYHVKVRAWREIDGKYYYGKWSKVKKVTVR